MKRNGQHPISQACAIPFRLREGQPEFCLITSVRKGRWVFPKGIVESGETPMETALKEAREEAGVQGRILDGCLGEYTYSKWGRKLPVSAYLMRVTVEEDDWDEADVRKRHWCGPAEARTMLARKSHRGLLDAALERINGSGRDDQVG